MKVSFLRFALPAELQSRLQQGRQGSNLRLNV